MKTDGDKDKVKDVVKRAPTIDPAAGLKGKAILVIDDDVAILIMVKKLLEREGMRVEVAESEMEGITKFRRFRPALVLLDVNLNAVETGFDICARLKQLSRDDAQAHLRHQSENKTPFVPVVFLTARASKDDVRRATSAGGDGYIVKPFTPETLLAKVYYHLDKAARHVDNG
jgi:DNA-binding response OmpR family regulator